MTFTTKTYRQIAKDILTQICGGETIEEHTYLQSKTVYKLVNIPVIDIKSVDGMFEGAEKTLFVKDIDYKLVDDAVEWINSGNLPDDNTIFSVKYVFSRSSGITDIHPGSVIRTISEAISREIEYLYLQMEQAYFSGFLDTATGNALDLVVSILGIKRKPPQPSSGCITFGRNSEPETFAVAGEIHLYDGSLEYTLNKILIKNIIKIEGTSNATTLVFEGNTDYVLSENIIKWLPTGNKPDSKTVFRVDYTAYQEIIIPKGISVATFSLKDEESRLFSTTDEGLLTHTLGEKWEVEVPIICDVPGRIGNVLAGTVVVMPQPLQGVEYLINKGDVINGVEAEGDDELKERTRHVLEFAGKATFSSLESAIRSVEGVRSLLIEDMPENVPGLVKVIVDGGSMEKIKQIINDTRAAGIKVEVFRPEIVYINVSLILILKKDVSPTMVIDETERKIRSYISTLEIGSDILYSRIVEAIVGLKDVWDVEDIILKAHKIDGSIIQSENENIMISNEERAEPRNINISYEVRSKK